MTFTYSMRTRGPTRAIVLCLFVASCSDDQSAPPPFGAEGDAGSTVTSSAVGSTSTTAVSAGNASSGSTGVLQGSTSQHSTASQSSSSSTESSAAQGTTSQGTTSQGTTSQGTTSGATGDFGSSSGGMGTSGGVTGALPTGSGGAAAVTGSTGEGNADCAPGSILCDGFEDYPPGDSPGGDWSASARGSGAIVVDTERAFTGNQSLHVSGQLNADHANITTAIEDSDVVYVRFMMYTASYPATSAFHVAVDWLRRGKLSNRRLEPLGGRYVAARRTPVLEEDRLEARAELNAIRQILRRMKPGRAAVLVLHDVQGYSVSETAGLLGIGVGAAESRLRRARFELRRRYNAGVSGFDASEDTPGRALQCVS